MEVEIQRKKNPPPVGGGGDDLRILENYGLNIVVPFTHIQSPPLKAWMKPLAVVPLDWLA